MKRLATPRDVLLFETESKDVWVSAVDSCGGIGKERYDSLQIDPVIVGMFTARVALLEVTAVGAKAVFASLAICSNQHTAEQLIRGVKMILGDDLPLVISTEKNFPVPTTGLGVTVTGICKHKDLLTCRAKAGDTLYCLGYPLVGEETLKPDVKIMELRHLKALLQKKDVNAAIPVGSKGIAAEAEILAKESNLKLELCNTAGVDLYKSAGPSTCAIFSASDCVDFKWDLPVFKIGILKNQR